MQKKEKEILLNAQVKDSGAKMIFDEPVLCAQFIRDYVDLPYMKEVKPEDIEDVSDQFVPLFAQERNADRVKRVNIRGENPFFLVSLIEHKTKIEYNLCMQIFRYMVYIWEDYEKKAEAIQEGITRQKNFKYPPILPIIYYEGNKKWTVPLDFKSRITHGDVFEKYIPNFQYYLVPICQYKNEELLEKADEISLIMLLSKLQTEQDVSEFRKISPEQLEEILKETPKHLLDKIANILLAFLLKANVPVPEAEELVGKVKEKKMAELFENIKIDVQETRRQAEEQVRQAEEQVRQAEEQVRQAEERVCQAEERACKAEERVCQAEARGCQAEERAYQAEEQAIRTSSETLQELGISRDMVFSKLVEKYSLSEELAEAKLREYWK